MLPNDKRSENLFESIESISNSEGVTFVDSTYTLMYELSKEFASIYFDIEELLPESIHKQSSATYVSLRDLAEFNFREKLLKSLNRQSIEDVQFVPANVDRYGYDPISQLFESNKSYEQGRFHDIFRWEFIL